MKTKQTELDAMDARRWRAIITRHPAAMIRLATGSGSYSSQKAPAILNAWADMAAAEIEGFCPDTYLAEIKAQIEEFERTHSRD